MLLMARQHVGQKSNYGNTLFDMDGVSQSRYHVAPWDVSKGMYPADEYLKNRDYSVFKNRWVRC